MERREPVELDGEYTPINPVSEIEKESEVGKKRKIALQLPHPKKQKLSGHAKSSKSKEPSPSEEEETKTKLVDISDTSLFDIESNLLKLDTEANLKEYEDLDDDDEEEEEGFDMEFDGELVIEEDDDDDYGSNGMDGFFENNVEQSKVDFKVVDVTNLINEQHTKVMEVSETLDIPVGTAGLLLKYFKWDQQRLYMEFFDNKKKISEKAGINLKEKPFLQPSDKNKEYECMICLEDFKYNQVYALSCGHFFCENCWKDYLEIQIKDGLSCLHTPCMFRGCKFMVTEELVKKLVSEKSFKRYSKFVARSFVDDNPRIKWCPAPNCGKAVYAGESVKQTDNVVCSCGQKFCFKCSLEAHEPCSCEELRKWKIKENDESETANWLTTNTKICPKCSKPIEKNGGCNHMTCSQCKHEWCWVCLDDWKEHGRETGGYYKCNRYSQDELKEKTDQKSRDDARAALEKYIHYFKRYAAHQQSQKFEKQLIAKAEENMKKLQVKHKFSSWIDVEFIQKAVHQLLECRNTLKYTYIFAYYMEEGAKKNLFEHLQEELEIQTEALSEILEGPSENYKREKILSHTKNAELRLNKLLEGCKYGLINY